MRLTYKTDGVQGSDLRVKVQAFSDPAQFFGHVLGASRFGTIEDQGGPCLLQSRHEAQSVEERNCAAGPWSAREEKRCTSGHVNGERVIDELRLLAAGGAMVCRHG